MNITRENIDNLNVVLNVKIEKQDYEQKVADALNDYKKKARIDGFRPGKVPLGLINKLYRKPVLAEEINKIISGSLSDYLVNEKLKVLGEPLPHIEDRQPIDFDTDETFEFKFDLGLAPEFEVKVSHKDKVPFYKIIVDDSITGKYVESYSQRFGSFESVETPAEKDIVKGEITQLDENNMPLEAGFHVDDAMLNTEFIQDPEFKERLLQVKKGDTLIADLKKAYPNDSEVAGLLKTDKAKVENLKGNFNILVKDIMRFKKAEVNQELFDKVYGPGNVKSVEEFRAKISEEAEMHLKEDSEYKFRIDVKDMLMKKLKISLPEVFLKRWLLAINEGKFTREQIDADYSKFEEDLKWQLLKDKILEENNIQVTEDDLKQISRDIARMQFRQYGMNDVPEEHLEKFAERMLQQEEDRNNIKSKAVERKVIDFVKGVVKVDEKEISTDKFNKLFEK